MSFRSHLVQTSSHFGTEFSSLTDDVWYNLFIKVWSFTQAVQPFAGARGFLVQGGRGRRGHTPGHRAPTLAGQLRKGTGWEMEAVSLVLTLLCLSVISKQPLWDFPQLQPAAPLWSQSITYRLLPIPPGQFTITKCIFYSAANEKRVCLLLPFLQ